MNGLIPKDSPGKNTGHAIRHALNHIAYEMDVTLTAICDQEPKLAELTLTDSLSVHNAISDQTRGLVMYLTALGRIQDKIVVYMTNLSNAAKPTLVKAPHNGSAIIQ